MNQGMNRNTIFTGWSISSATNFNCKIISDESRYFTFQTHHRKEETFLHQIHVTEGHLKNVARQNSWKYIDNNIITSEREARSEFLLIYTKNLSMSGRPAGGPWSRF